jgi:F0F1-type ATP synthase membrane subunit b/b'
MSGTSRTVVKKTRDAALEHVRKTLRNGGSLLTRLEASFVRTSCHISGLDGEAVLKAIVKKAKEKGGRQPRKVLDQLQAQLAELAERVDKHKRPTPNPAASTRAVDSMGAPVRSLAHLQGCADALREATEGQYSKGIKAAKKAMENAKSDFKATIDRVAEASRWKQEMIEDWLSRGKMVCANLLEEAEKVLREAEAREEAEAKIRIMEGQCEELVSLAEQAGNQIPAEAEVELLVDLEEEIGQRKEMVGNLGRALKEIVPEELKGRVEEAIQESVVMAKKGRRYVDHVKTRLEFGSKDSEASSYKGATGAAPGRWQTAAEELREESEPEDKVGAPSGVSSGDLLDFMRGFGHMQAMIAGGLSSMGDTPITRDSRRSGEPTGRPTTLR